MKKKRKKMTDDETRIFKYRQTRAVVLALLWVPVALYFVLAFNVLWIAPYAILLVFMINVLVWKSYAYSDKNAKELLPKIGDEPFLVKHAYNISCVLIAMVLWTTEFTGISAFTTVIVTLQVLSTNVKPKS